MVGSARKAAPLLTLFVALTLSAQHEVAIVTLHPDAEILAAPSRGKAELIFPFELDRNLIWVEAAVEGLSGQFILDTGAPTLILNDRGGSSYKRIRAQAAGGAVTFAEQTVRSFELGGVEHGAQPALSLDLRDLELRTGRTLQGMVGYEQLEDYELLIDYPNQEIRLYPARKNALHASASPKLSLRFTYLDHLPVIALENGRQKLYFAIDTGAGSNLLHAGLSERKLAGWEPLAESITIRGLDGVSDDCPKGHLSDLTMGGSITLANVPFVKSDMSHLRFSGESIVLDGILGTEFLKGNRISIDYRRRKIHFW